MNGYITSNQFIEGIKFRFHLANKLIKSFEMNTKAIYEFKV